MSEKRLIIATVLSTLIIVFWWLWFTPRQQLQQTPPGVTPAVTIKQIPENALSSEKAAATEKTETIETENVKVVFAGRGARIIHYYIKEGKDASKYLDMILPPAKISFEPGIFETFPGTVFRTVKKSSDSISFGATVDGVNVLKEFYFNPSNLNEIRISLKNTSARFKEINLQTTWGPGVGCNPDQRKDEISVMRVVTATYTPRKTFKVTDIKPGQYYISGHSWVGMDNRYFCVIALNPCAPNYCSHFDQITVSKVTDEKLFAVTLSTRIALAAGSFTAFEIPFYMGPKDYTKLVKLGFGLQEIVDFGFFAQVAKFAFYSLKYFYGLFHNYGIAIIILTIILQIIFYPLTVKSYKASGGMRLLQPKIKELQARFSKDPKRLNAEMLNLYKTQKVNPLSGCLPMLIQLPIFWALFVTLRNTYELRQAPFFWWINDLSVPDMLFSAFGQPIRLLPLLMGISMYVQQKISGATMDPQQKMLAYIMPVMFTFIFWNFPSGLVLYWLINNIVSIGIQYAITMKQSASIPSSERVIDAEVIETKKKS